MVQVMNFVKSGNRERSHRDRHKGCQIYSFVILENQRWRIPLGKYHSQWSNCVLRLRVRYGGNEEVEGEGERKRGMIKDRRKYLQRRINYESERDDFSIYLLSLIFSLILLLSSSTHFREVNLL